MTKERLVDRTPQLLCPSGGIIWGAPTGLPSIPQREQAQFNHSSHLLDDKLFMGFLSYPNLPTFLLLFPRMTLNKSLVLGSLSHSMLQRETKQRQHLFLLWPVLAIFVFLGEISEAWKPKSQRNLSLKYSHFLLLILQLKPIINFPLIKYSDSPPAWLILQSTWQRSFPDNFWEGQGASSDSAHPSRLILRISKFFCPKLFYIE